MYFSEVMKKCESEGIKITRMGLYVAGKKNGFIIPGNDGNEFDKEKFLEWLQKAKQKAPEGWLKMKDIPEVLNISLSQAYKLIEEGEVEFKKIGTKGVIYVDPERLREIIKNRSNRYNLQGEANE